MKFFAKASFARIVLLGLSFASLLVCAICTVAYYQKRGWGDHGELAGWLAAMLLLLLAFAPQPHRIVTRLRELLTPRTAFFAFWILVFIGSRLWSFRTAPWNGDGLFDESGWDLWFLKSYVMGHPYQAAWFHSPISRETLFHYYVWGFFRLWGQNILSYEAALGVIWCASFLFTILVIDLLFRSYVVTSVSALIFNFLPFAFIYTFAGYRYPMATALAVASLYFLLLGFRNASGFHLAWGGLLAGLCLASSISGKQYLVALGLFVVVYGVVNWMTSRRPIPWGSVLLVLYAGFAAAVPILGYIAFNRTEYTVYEASFVHSFWQAVLGHPSPNTLTFYVQRLGRCFFAVPGDRFFIPDALPIPLPYYLFLVPGLFIALRRGRYEIPFLGIVPVIGAFIATAFDNRLLLAIPFWIIAMAFTVDALGKLHLRGRFIAIIWVVALFALVAGLVPSVRYIYKKAESPFTIRHYAQEEVAVSRYLRHVVAGDVPADPLRIERNEFKRVKGIPEPSYDTLICQDQAYSIIHLFLHDYDDRTILSFCGGSPLYVMPNKEVWRDNKLALLSYIPRNKNLKLVWERVPSTEPIINKFTAFRDLGREATISFSFAGKKRQFYVFEVDNKNIPQLQERVRVIPE